MKKKKRDQIAESIFNDEINEAIKHIVLTIVHILNVQLSKNMLKLIMLEMEKIFLIGIEKGKEEEKKNV